MYGLSLSTPKLRSMKLYIKYMVSLRCKMLVKEELRKLGIQHAEVDLGMVDIYGDITDEQHDLLSAALLKSGLLLMDSENALLIEKIKQVVVEMVHYSDELPRVNFSDYLSEKLGLDYNYLANLFSEVKGITLKRYLIAQKIERVKELLIYDKLSLVQISYKLNYSSVAHLSNQFKSVTGLTPTFFKQMKHIHQRALAYA